MEKLSNNIEAVLFLKGEPVSIDELAKILDATHEEVEQGLLELEESLLTRGIRLMRKEKT
jgi:segregation and condensation protein B